MLLKQMSGTDVRLLEVTETNVLKIVAYALYKRNIRSVY